MSNKNSSLNNIKEMINRLDKLKRILIPEISSKFEDAFVEREQLIANWRTQCNHIFYKCVLKGDSPSVTDEVEYYECPICGFRINWNEDIQYVDTVYRFNNTPYEFPKIQNAKNEHWVKQIENLDNKIKALEDEYSSLEQEYEDLDEELKQISFCIDEYFGYYQCKDTNDCPRNKFQEFQD